MNFQERNGNQMIQYFSNFSLIILLISLLSACQNTRPPAAPHFDETKAVSHFSGIAFGSELAKNPIDDITKWSEPIHWFVHTWSDDARRFTNAMAARHIGELSNLSGIQIWPTDNITDANLIIAVWPTKDLPSVIESTGADVTMTGSNCITYAVHKNDRTINAAVIFIRAELPNDDLRSCLVIETTQAMGLTRDGGVIRGSVAMEGHLTIDRLAEIDRLMLRTLYDPRLKPGMTRDEAMPIARQIIHELWPSVRQPD